MEIWAVFVHEKNQNNLGFVFAMSVKGVCGYCFYIVFKVKVFQQLYHSLVQKHCMSQDWCRNCRNAHGGTKLPFH